MGKQQHTNQIKISVVIPVFNREKLVIEAIESVLSQTYLPYELIVVDDGSTDQTYNKTKRYLEANTKGISFKLIKQQNKGGNIARNKGIEHASGTWVAFLDSDDLWDSTKLEKQVKLIDTNLNVGAIYCGVKHVNATNTKVIGSISRIYPSGNLLPQLLVRDITAPTSTYLIKRKVFDEVGGFDLNLQARQDWDMWIRVASKYNILSVPEALVGYREHEGIRTNTNPEKEINAYGAIREKYEYLLVKESWHVRRAAKSACLKRMGRVHFHYKSKPVPALKYYFGAIYYNPFDIDGWYALLGFFMPKRVRQKLHYLWNNLLGSTRISIKSH